MKSLDKVEKWGNKTTQTKNGFLRVSNWITLKETYNPRQDNSLYYYTEDLNGYNPTSIYFNKKDSFLQFFRHKGKTYALSQFVGIGSMADGIGHTLQYIEYGEKFYLHGWDGENIFYPLYIEINKTGEKVRLYVSR